MGLAVFVLGNVLFFQSEWHWGVIATGLGIFPGPLASAIFASNAGRIIAKYGKTLPAVVGPLLFAAGAIAWIFIATENSDHWVAFLAATFVTGIGGGLVQAPLYAAASSLPEDRAVTGSAVLNMAGQIGSALGVAILVALLAANHGLSGYQHGWLLVAISMGIAAVASASFAVTKWIERHAPGA
jgi:MFS family permease